MDYKKYLLVSDIDGTALVAGKPIPEKNITAINEFIARGGRFTICTGRGSKSASIFTNLLNLNEPAIICNGTCIYDFDNRGFIFKQTLPSGVIKIVREFIENFKDTGVEVVKEPDVYLCNTTEIALQHAKNRNINYKFASIDEFDDDLSKVVFICDDKDKESINSYLTETLKENNEIKSVWTNEHLVELVPKNANKAVGLKKLCEAINVDIKNVVAVGDFYNDIDLLNAARVKVVVGNAPEELKKMADVVVSSCLEGGLAEVVNNFEEIVNKYIEGEKI